MLDSEVDGLRAEVAFLRSLVSEALPRLRTASEEDESLADRMQGAISGNIANLHAPVTPIGQMPGSVAHDSKRVLDPCCGGRMMWFDRRNPDVVFGDRRHEVISVTDRSRGNPSGIRELRIEPDTVMDFRELPYLDETFKLVAFDPPHLVHAGPRSWLAAKYGKLSPDWREDIRKGFSECFRVLAPDGVLVFKWNEDQVKLKDVLALTDQKPLFGHPTGRKGLTHWLVFMKTPEETA